MKRTGVARAPLRKGERLSDKIEAQLASIKRMPQSVPIVLRHSRCRLDDPTALSKSARHSRLQLG